jgi:hypothetical protein
MVWLPCNLHLLCPSIKDLIHAAEAANPIMKCRGQRRGGAELAESTFDCLDALDALPLVSGMIDSANPIDLARIGARLLTSSGEQAASNMDTSSFHAGDGD